MEAGAGVGDDDIEIAEGRRGSRRRRGDVVVGRDVAHDDVDGGLRPIARRSATASSRVRRRASSVTAQPFAASATAVAAPIPADAPLTSATRPPLRHRPNSFPLADGRTRARWRRAIGQGIPVMRSRVHVLPCRRRRPRLGSVAGRRAAAACQSRRAHRRPIEGPSRACTTSSSSRSAARTPRPISRRTASG